MMTMKDLDALNRAHDWAVKELGSASIAIAETVSEGGMPTEDMLKAYSVAKLGVESTRRDLEHCLQLELAEIYST